MTNVTLNAAEPNTAEPKSTGSNAAGPNTPEPNAAGPSSQCELWVERLALTDYRNYSHAVIELDERPVILTGPNGAGKTNLMEAVSLLAPGRGLRRAPFNDLARFEQGDARDGSWAIAAKLNTGGMNVAIGTGLQARASSDRAGRLLRIDGVTKSGSGVLADYVEMVWLTPAMDGLFTGSATERRRFIDRLILCFDPSYRTRVGRFERAMRQRNRLLDEGGHGSAQVNAQLDGLELIMAETGVAMAAARAEAVAQLSATIDVRRQRSPNSPFPWAHITLQGRLENEFAAHPAVDVEDIYLNILKQGRERDRAAGRTLDGPHRSDLVVGHGPKAMPARVCSTGEQKALLVGLVLAHAELMKQRRDGGAPILLLDEIAAHLDEYRRAALFDEILVLGAQAWMTGTDAIAFQSLGDRAQYFDVDEANITRAA